MNRSSHFIYFMSALGKTSAQQVRHVVQATERKIEKGLVCALVLLLVLGVVLYQTTLKFRATERWESRIEAVLAELDVISAQLTDAEMGQRGYLITGDERYLEPYRVVFQTNEQKLQNLRALSVDNLDLQRKIDILAPLITEKLAAMEQIYDSRKNRGFEPATQVILMDQGQQITNDILQLIEELKDDENQLLQQETDEADAREQTINLSITFGSFLAIILAAFMIIHDIVQRKRADEALRESAARFHRLAENALDMIYRYRLLPKPGFEYVSPAATVITGYTPEEFYADPDLSYKLVHHEDHELTESLKHPSDTTEPLTVRWTRKDGTVIWTSQQLVPISDSEGNLVAIEGIVRDVTERMEAYQMLEQRVEERTHEIERRRQVAEGLHDIVTVLNSNRPLDEILDSIVAQACRLLGTDAGAVYHLQEQKGLLSTQVARGLEADVAAINIPVGWGAVGEAMLKRQPVVASNALAALVEENDPVLDPQQWARLASLFSRYGALLVIPLMVKDEIYGAITLYYSKPREFTREETELAAAFGDQAALAIENARLRIQAERVAVAAERSRLARDLHDAVTQTLFSTSLIADVLPRLWERNRSEAWRRLEELRQLTRGALAEMRQLLLELRPATLVEVGIGDLLRQLAEAITGRARIPVILAVDGQYDLPPDVQIVFYRIAQEALNNIARHAGASQAVVRLCGHAERLELSISDDGQGFDPACVPLEHLGLSIMRERADTIGATLRIETRLGSGTQVVITWSPGGDAHEELRESVAVLHPASFTSSAIPSKLLGLQASIDPISMGKT
jgi:PAS domain S-box-containing protein